ncbi:hypothetical protein CPC08DRAFT_634812 [Agrocybe pediades]|nr:hypothetical protein CPC08DRAFT_634812 [Agrocybe pediades]
MDPDQWRNPVRDFVYSQGAPRGKTKNGVQCQILKGTEGQDIECSVSYATCEYMATRELVYKQVELQNMDARLSATPSTDLLMKTFEYFSALRRLGCSAPPFEKTIYTEEEKRKQEKHEAQLHMERRGHSAKPTCDGRLLFEYSSNSTPLIRCEHYSRASNRDHFFDFNISNGQVDADYLEALFLDDKDALIELESDARARKIGPGAECKTVRNFSSNKPTCSSTHRTADGELFRPQMTHIPCKVKFKIYEPLENLRSECPWALVTCLGAHTHPVPVPSSTPPQIEDKINDLLHLMEHDLPDMTPRRFLRHPLVQAYLKRTFPHLSTPMLLDLHPSLANREHLRVYINRAQRQFCPEGTGWEGLLDQYKKESKLDIEDRYMRYVCEIPGFGNDGNLNVALDDENTLKADAPFRLAICMFRESSRRLQKARYLQSDIGFKRIVGFKEFELGGLDSVSRTSVTFCRAYLNRQTAEAHRFLFQQIDEIVRNDTGQYLRWRHIHSPSLRVNQEVGICQLAVDQHGGQAKGFGLYLMDVAGRLPLPKHDIHEPHKIVQELDEYEHLRRILRLCTVHFARNIKTCAVDDDTRHRMRSLMCVRHAQWHVTLREIRERGGKAAADWLADKERAKFVFPAICCELSLIPEHIWRAADNSTNIIEELHQDVNREGLHCTLVGGMQKGKHFDMLKLKTLIASETSGIHVSYHEGHISQSIKRSLVRKATAQTKALQKEDKAIEAANDKLLNAYHKLENASSHYQACLNARSPSTKKAGSQLQKARSEFDKLTNASRSHIGKGSGKVALLLPTTV